MQASVRRRPQVEPWGTTSILPVCSDGKLPVDTQRFLLCIRPTGQQPCRSVLIDCMEAFGLNVFRSIPVLAAVSARWCTEDLALQQPPVLASLTAAFFILLSFRVRVRG